jgi:hypothetical protein
MTEELDPRAALGMPGTVVDQVAIETSRVVASELRPSFAPRAYMLDRDRRLRYVQRRTESMVTALKTIREIASRRTHPAAPGRGTSRRS